MLSTGQADSPYQLHEYDLIQSCHVFDGPVRRSGTHCQCQMNSEIRRVMSTASHSSLKQSCSALTSVTSALEVIFNVMHSINPRFIYLLTYYPSTYIGRGQLLLRLKPKTKLLSETKVKTECSVTANSLGLRL